MKRFLYELSESWKIAVAQMRSNKTRSTLTALGVIIGIVAVTLMGTAIGIFLGLPGLIFGPMIGATAGEYLARRDLYQAGRAGLATWMGLLIGVGVKLGLAFLMVGIFITTYFWH